MKNAQKAEERKKTSLFLLLTSIDHTHTQWSIGGPCGRTFMTK